MLTNVDLIGEGFDVPDCECVLLLRPTESLTLYIQSSTRCLRPNGDKKAIIIDYVNNVQRHGMPFQKQTLPRTIVSGIPVIQVLRQEQEL